MSEPVDIAENFEEAWPVPEKSEEGSDSQEKEADALQGDQGEFLFDLLSSDSRNRLLSLADLPQDSLIQAFLSGGSNNPRIVTLFTSEAENTRLASLLEIPIRHHIENLDIDTRPQIIADPPHLLFIQMESHEEDTEKWIEELLKEPTLSSLSVVALVRDPESPYLTAKPEWAQTTLPLTLSDQAFQRHLRNLIDLARARMDIETIYLSHRLSRVQLHTVQYTDSLTGLLNRRGFEDTAARELSRVARTKESAGLVIIDIDKFKNINDTYGHPAGDEVLRELAQILEENSRTLDHVFRFGGEEFGLILPHTDFDEMIAMAERMRAEVEKHHFRDMPEAGAVTISLGALCIGPSRQPMLKDVYPVADALLYKAKQEGRNRVVSDRFF